MGFNKIKTCISTQYLILLGVLCLVLTQGKSEAMPIDSLSRLKTDIESKTRFGNRNVLGGENLLISQKTGSAPPPGTQSGQAPPPPPPEVSGSINGPAPIRINSPSLDYLTGQPGQSNLADKLTLTKGMKIIFSINQGVDTRWKNVGDYTFETTIIKDTPGYAFDWHMSPPANATGSRAVDQEDLKTAHKVSLFYPDNESATLIGYTSIVRISDYLYNKLKSGERADFELDGPDSPVVMKKHTRPVPNFIYPVGLENVSVIVNGANEDLRCIKAQTDVGWTYWILDNRNFPLMVQGDGPFQWKSAQLSYGAPSTGSGDNKIGSNTSSGGNSKAKSEADKMIDQLKKAGKATSYLILFDFDSDRLRPLSKEVLIELSQYLKRDQALRLRVEGHTCSVGGKEYNLDLSQRRAESVKRFLTQNCGIESERLIPVGYGYSKPVASNKNEAGRVKNRRVVFTEIK